MNSLIRANRFGVAAISRRNLATFKDWFGKKPPSEEQQSTSEPSVIQTLEKSELISNDYEAIKTSE